jgi:hypothetical protein
VNKNPEKSLVFKMKTNAPKSYKVVPTVGIMEANSSGYIDITYVPLLSESNTVSKNKFQILMAETDELSVNDD